MRIRLFFQKTWFLGLLCIMCFVGYVGHAWVEKLMSVYPPKAHIFALMFLMSFSLRADSLRKGITSYKLHATMFFINYILATAIAVMLAFIFFRNNQGLFVGLLIVAAVPSTMASATVWTRLANGNDGISMSFTFISNISTFIVSPTLLAVALFFSGICVTTPEGAQVSLFKCFPFMRTLYDLAIAVIIPVAIGQGVRLALPRLAERSKKNVT